MDEDRINAKLETMLGKTERMVAHATAARRHAEEANRAMQVLPSKLLIVAALTAFVLAAGAMILLS